MELSGYVWIEEPTSRAGGPGLLTRIARYLQSWAGEFDEGRVWA